MESAINVLVAQFKTFASKDGSSHTLSKEEFQTLVASQLPNLVKVSASVQCSYPVAVYLLVNHKLLYVKDDVQCSAD